MRKILLGAMAFLLCSVATADAYYIPRFTYRPAVTFRPAITYRPTIRTYHPTIRSYHVQSYRFHTQAGTRYHTRYSTYNQRIGGHFHRATTYPVSQVVHATRQNVQGPVMTAHKTTLPDGIHHNPSHTIGNWGNSHGRTPFL